MVFRRALLFLSSLLLVLYALVLLNGQGDGRLLLSDYWVPRRSQLPGLAPPSTTRHLKLNDSVLEQLAKVDALAEQMEKESAEQPNIAPTRKRRRLTALKLRLRRQSSNV